MIYDFFDQVEQVYRDCGVSERSAALIFNTDESGFASDPTQIRAVGEKGKPLHRAVDGSCRDSITVLACVSATGDCLPPLIVFKGMAVQSRWTSVNEYPGTMYGANSNGWMEEESFYQWLEKMFVRHVQDVRQKLNLPDQAAILFFDGHCSHISLRIVELAAANKIHLIKFPSHMTDKLQPLDVCVFGPIKKAWQKKLVEYGVSQMGKGPSQIPKPYFVEILGGLWRMINKNNIKSGFECTGLYPLDRNRVKDSWFDPNHLQRYKRHKAMESRRNLIQEEDHVITHPMSVLGSLDVNTKSPIVNDDPDMPIDLSLPKTSLLTATESNRPKDLIQVFSESIARATMMVQAGPSNANSNRRLKHHTMGEVLTSPDVQERLRLADEVKVAKKRKKETASKSAKTKKSNN